MQHSVISWNVKGLRSRLGEVGQLVNKYQPTVLMLQETWLSDVIPTPYFHGYTVYRQDRAGARGGGILTAVRSTLQHVKAPPIQAGKAQVMGIKVGDLFLYNIYLPPQAGTVKCYRALDRGRPGTLFFGDWNAICDAFGDPASSANGRMLNSYLSKGGSLCMRRPEGPTHKHASKQTETCLDYVLCSPDVKLTSIAVLKGDHFTSDHWPVKITVGPEAGKIFRSITNWVGVAEELDRPWVRTASVEYDLGHFTASCQAAMLNNTSLIQVKSRKHRLLPQEIRTLQKRREALHREVRKTPQPGKTALRREVRQLGRRIAGIFKEGELRKVREEFDNIEDPALRWETLKKGKPRPPPIPTLTSPRGPAVDSASKAEVLADALQAKFVNTMNTQSKERKRTVRTAVEGLRDLDPGKVPVLTVQDLDNALRQLKARSAPGPDGITNRLLKALPDGAKAHLVTIFNRIISTRRFPAEWKVAFVTMLAKEGKPAEDPNSYRPISLLSCLSKLFERCVAPYICLLPVPDRQFGFRPGHSCTMQLTRLVTDLTEATNKKQAAVVVSLDIEAAFDKVPHDELLHKLLVTGQPVWLVQLVASYYKGRSFAVQVNGELSTARPIAAGTAQGAIWSPPFFSLYLYDMPVSKGVQTYQYADDTGFVCIKAKLPTALARLNKHLAKIHTWCGRWRTKVNPTKSIAMQIGTGRAKAAPNLTMGEEAIPWVDQAKYLGVVIDRRLSFSSHVDHLVKKGRASISTLSKYANARNIIQEATKLTLYKALVLPSLTYGLPAWQGVSQRAFERLRVLERKWIRMVTMAPRYLETHDLYERCTAINLRAEAEGAREQFRLHSDHPNPLIRDIFLPRPPGKKAYPLDNPAPGLF